MFDVKLLREMGELIANRVVAGVRDAVSDPRAANTDTVAPSGRREWRSVPASVSDIAGICNASEFGGWRVHSILHSSNGSFVVMLTREKHDRGT